MSRTIARTQGQRSKPHGSFQVLALSAPWLRPYFTESLDIWQTCITLLGDMSRTNFGMKGQGHEVVSSFGPVHGFVLIWLDHFVGDIHTAQERTMCHVPLLGRKVKVKVTRVVSISAQSAPWLRPYVIKPLHMWSTYNIWGDDVSRTIFNMKVQKSRSHRSFEVFTLSAPWLPPYWLMKRVKYVGIWHTAAIRSLGSTSLNTDAILYGQFLSHCFVSDLTGLQ